MSRKTKTDKAPPAPELPSRVDDEGNIAFLGLISVQERIPEGFTSWQVDFELDGRPARLVCVGAAEHGGVPHGLDNDVSLAVLALYQGQGCPEDGAVLTTAHQLLRTIGLPPTGHYYKALRESLKRLSHTTYTASHAWRRGDRWVNEEFRYLERVRSTSGAAGELDGRTVLEITVGKEIAASVRARHIKPLDFELLTRLKRPLTRGLLRLLDGRRFAAGGAAVRAFEVGLLEWADVCKILDKRPEKVRRTLQGAHEELLHHGYLEAVEYVGRGKGQRIRYRFAAGQPLPDPEAVELLLLHGLSPGVAQHYARNYPLEHLKARVALYRAILEQGYRPRNPAGFLVDVIKDEVGKYANPADFTPAPPARGPRARADNERSLREVEENAWAQWRAMTPEQRLNHLRLLAGLTLRRHLDVAEFDRLFGALEEGEVDPEWLYRQIQAHSAPHKAPALARALRERLAG